RVGVRWQRLANPEQVVWIGFLVNLLDRIEAIEAIIQGERVHVYKAGSNDFVHFQSPGEEFHRSSTVSDFAAGRDRERERREAEAHQAAEEARRRAEQAERAHQEAERRREEAARHARIEEQRRREEDA